MAERLLYLARHAKSSWEHIGLSDRQRPLAPRGERAAPAMGQWLALQGPGPQCILSSPAVRALATARHLVLALDQDPDDIEINEAIYFQGPDGMLDALATVDNKVQRVMLVGHNPDSTSLLQQLTGAGISNMPTAAIAIIELSCDDWADVAARHGRLLAYQYPKGL